MKSPYRPIRIAAWGVLGFAALFIIGGSIGWWASADYEQAVGEVSRWCERVRSGLMREPINTLGNIGFVISGLSMFAVLARDTITDRPRENSLIGNQPVALLYASAVVFLGPGSMLMHGSHTFFGAWMDNVSMVTYILIPWLFNLSVLGKWKDRTFFISYGSVLSGYAIAYWFFGNDLGIGLDLFGVSIGLWIISEVLYRFWSPGLRPLSGFVGFVVAFAFGITPATMLDAPAEYWWVVLFWIPGLLAKAPTESRRVYIPWFWAGIASFFVAYAIWLTGTNDHAWCDPDSIFQAHAIWHLLTALATWCFFMFLRTERARAGVDQKTDAASVSQPFPKS